MLLAQQLFTGEQKHKAIAATGAIFGKCGKNRITAAIKTINVGMIIFFIFLIIFYFPINNIIIFSFIVSRTHTCLHSIYIK